MTPVKKEDCEPEKNLGELFRKAALEYGMKLGGSTVVLPNGLAFVSSTRENMGRQVETIGNLFPSATQGNGFLVFDDNDVVAGLDLTPRRERRAPVGGIFVYYDKNIVAGLGPTAVNTTLGGRRSDDQQDSGNPSISMSRHDELRDECVKNMLRLKHKLHFFKDSRLPTVYFYDLRESRYNRLTLAEERDERDRSPPASRTSLRDIYARGDSREACRAYLKRKDVLPNSGDIWRKPHLSDENQRGEDDSDTGLRYGYGHVSRFGNAINESLWDIKFKTALR
ncbi:hypothetical protein CSAL01_02143 [Colletotrichum salicis]|uniref:Uncharacterized protein n=1 Tax=Colletotrichum salicis TaxID=1209931 RepID=A0A135UUA8_9PEZI|nr:hypothetical protein CSAL01_02143 [Colletotrichum salicis]